jgi:hypothetical protein
MTTPARQNQVRAHMNHVVIEDAQIAPDVINGMILTNENNAMCYLILENLIHL